MEEDPALVERNIQHYRRILTDPFKLDVYNDVRKLLIEAETKLAVTRRKSTGLA